MKKKDEAAYEKMIIIQLLSEIEQLFIQIRHRLEEMQKIKSYKNSKV
jgi:hypothetical protein